MRYSEVKRTEVSIALKAKCSACKFARQHPRPTGYQWGGSAKGQTRAQFLQECRDHVRRDLRVGGEFLIDSYLREKWDGHVVTVEEVSCFTLERA